jgi:type IV pilus assembly protein PilB
MGLQSLTTANCAGRRIGDVLLSGGAVTPEQMAEALAEQGRTKARLGEILIDAGVITEEQLADALGREYGLPVFMLSGDPIDEALLSLVPARIARDHDVLPIARTDRSLTIAMGDPTDLSAIDEIAFITNLRVITVIAPRSRLRQLIEAHYQSLALTLEAAPDDGPAEDVTVIDDAPEDHSTDLSELRAAAGDAPVVRLVNSILLDAVRRRASDVHFEPGERAFRVRFRIDGILREAMTPAKRLEAAMLSRLKIMANMDIAERRLPQNGRVKLRCSDRSIDVRVSTMPTVFGESISLRILDRAALAVDLVQLGFDPAGLERLRAAIRRPHGLVVITGPTGAGKTTTLYSAIQALNTTGVKIVTIEDPVEYHIKGIYQVEVNERVGRTFGEALRATLRHDPDIVLVGEIRDLETAEIAVRASLTGHLVLTTLHTNDCASTIARLVDMGVPSFLLASSLELVVAQRLVRRVCPRCGPAAAGAKPAGCPACQHTGYKGRVGLYEVMRVTPTIRSLIQTNAPSSQIEAAAREDGLQTLGELGRMKLEQSITTAEEISRVAGP